MLALKRREGESIIITSASGEKIKIQLVRIYGNRRAMFGIEAPQSFQIDCEEVTKDKDAGIPAPH